MESEVKPISHFYVQCEGCGNTIAVSFPIQPHIVMAAPIVACSQECLNRWVVTTAAFLERRVRDA